MYLLKSSGCSSYVFFCWSSSSSFVDSVLFYEFWWCCCFNVMFHLFFSFHLYDFVWWIFFPLDLMEYFSLIFSFIVICVSVCVSVYLYFPLCVCRINMLECWVCVLSLFFKVIKRLVYWFLYVHNIEINHGFDARFYIRWWLFRYLQNIILFNFMHILKRMNLSPRIVYVNSTFWFRRHTFRMGKRETQRAK